MVDKILIKKQMSLLDEFGNSEIKIIFIIKTINFNKCILEIFDSKGRHFISHNIKYTDEDYIKYTKDLDIRYQEEYNFEKRKNDVWIELYLINDIYILNQEYDELCLETITNKINFLTDELELLKKRKDLLQNTYYPCNS